MKLKTPRLFPLEFGHRFVIASLLLFSPFFLFFSPEINIEGIEINFPKNDGIHCGKPPLILVTTSEKEFYLNNSKVEFSNLEKELVLKTKRDEDPEIILRLDSSASVQELVDILSIGAKNHLKMTMVLLEKEEIE